ncbi:MAG TPA: hypothetical protein VF534_38730 [Paraburkholderia sp.]
MSAVLAMQIDELLFGCDPVGCEIERLHEAQRDRCALCFILQAN